MITPDERIIETAEGRFKTRVLTAGSGSPVVFFHGAGGLFWDPFLDNVAARHQVFAPEHLGCGQSQGLENAWDLWDLVLYYAELFDALGIERASVVGHSFGGMVAAEMAATNGRYVDKLVLIAPIGLWLDDHPIPDITTIMPDQLPGLVLAHADSPLAAMLPTPDPSDPEALLAASNSMAAINQFIWPLPDKGLDRRLYRIKADTLIIWGRQDHLVDPAYGGAFAAAIKGSRLETVDEAGHLPQLEALEQVSALVTSFIG